MRRDLGFRGYRLLPGGADQIRELLSGFDTWTQSNSVTEQGVRHLDSKDSSTCAASVA